VRIAMQMDAQTAVAGNDGVVLDQAHRRIDQGAGVWMVVVPVAGDVEHRHQAASAVEDGGGGAGEKFVAAQIMLRPQHLDRSPFGDRRTHGVGAAHAFVPDRTGGQVDPLRAFEERRISLRLYDQTLCVGDDEHAAACIESAENALQYRTGKP